MQTFFQEEEESVWSDYSKFKAVFMQNLYRFLTQFKKTFGINDNPEIQNLENMIVNTMYWYNKQKNLEELNQGLFDQLDLDMYEEFLTFKADYDKFDHLSLDDNLISQLKVRILNFLD